MRKLRVTNPEFKYLSSPPKQFFVFVVFNFNISTMDNLIMISQFVLSLTILVVLHECGHFFPARWFKTRVEKFYLFFDPYFALFKKKIGETEYGIGWLPLGGYVKISGMVDESFDTEQLKQEPQPWEFRSKPAWQRLIIMLGGVTVNFILGFFIFGMLLWRNGIEYLPTANMTYGISVDSFAYAMGFRDGDKIIKIGNSDFERFDRGKLLKSIVLENATNITVLRNEVPVELKISPDYAQKLAKPEIKSMELWGARIPISIARVLDNSSASKSGVLPGDIIYSIDGENVGYLHEAHRKLKNKPNTAFKLGILRGADSINISVLSDEKGIIGLGWKLMDKFLKTEKEHFSFFESLPKGVTTGVDLLSGQLMAFKQMFAGKIKAKDSLGGFASIANMFEKTWDWTSFWKMTGILSIILGFMNLLPIPALDGGYVVFLLIEVISGKRFQTK